MSDTKSLVFEEILKKYVMEEIMTKSEFYEIYHKERREDRHWIVGTILAVGLGLAGLIVALLHH